MQFLSGHPRTLFCKFSVFSRHDAVVQQINMKNSIYSQDSNLQPLDHESAPIAIVLEMWVKLGYKYIVN